MLFQKLGFPEHQTFGLNFDEDEAKVLLLTSCYQDVPWQSAHARAA